MKRIEFVIAAATLALAIMLYISNIQISAVFGQQAEIVAKFVDQKLPITNPNSELWNKVPARSVALGPQMTAAPWIHPEPAIRSLSVKALHNGTWVAFLLEWSDETKDDIMKTDTFRDAVAIMLALQPGAGQCMGTPTANVVIAHWKADWQRDIDEAFTDIADLYPNFWSDWYPILVTSKSPATLEELVNGTLKEFFAGWAAGNVLSTPFRTTPVEALIAKGWGTLTTLEEQAFVGRGIHDGAKWRVVIARPVATGYADPPWANGEPVEIAFAAWDGASGEIGAKKGVSLPMTFKLEEAPTKVVEAPTPAEAPVLRLELIIAGVIAVAIAAIIVAMVIAERRGSPRGG